MGVYAGEKRMRGGVSEVRGRGNRISEDLEGVTDYRSGFGG